MSLPDDDNDNEGDDEDDDVNDGKDADDADDEDDNDDDDDEDAADEKSGSDNLDSSCIFLLDMTDRAPIVPVFVSNAFCNRSKARYVLCSVRFGRINCVLLCFLSQTTAIASLFLQTLIFCTRQIK